ncbi:5-formyltetrahydrofolate cyclo-ligase [Hydrogenivirga sp. 128-5-R1-1]|uniref:5-formyltetrahydrofolate cyclo-ligase n=1 Tax=Hydrogenivirga sp. 128-5-R1-1 TaxID=392423 RepID=UPI00015F36EF|nr:5-formyltetrahydrofolate cyclo-ligase [Hydrogenivirga sp. 128-5-R1-1]EDP76338.1 hypothetical protein HG1285_01988 [Hydrogenivirga sp. 128-5-R1-1]
MIVEKGEIRKEILKRRVSLPYSLRSSYDERIREKLVSLPEFSGAHRILLYCPVKGEPDLSPLFGLLLESGKRLVLPKVDGEELSLIEVESPLCLSKGTFNIPEPQEGVKIEPEMLELAVVPGVAFDREGFRLGFGKGYYDRLLERVRAPTVGVAYSFQVLSRVPRDSWDRPVDIVVTEKEVIRRY